MLNIGKYPLVKMGPLGMGSNMYKIDYAGWLADLEDIYHRLDEDEDRDTLAFAVEIIRRLEEMEAMFEKQGQTLQ